MRPAVPCSSSVVRSVSAACDLHHRNLCRWSYGSDGPRRIISSERQAMQLPNELLRAPQHDCPAVEAGPVTRPQRTFSDLKVTLTSLRRAFAICEENRRLTTQS